MPISSDNPRLYLCLAQVPLFAVFGATLSLVIGDLSLSGIEQVLFTVMLLASFTIAVIWFRRQPTWRLFNALLVGFPLGLCLSPLLRQIFGLGEGVYGPADFLLIKATLFVVCFTGIAHAFLKDRIAGRLGTASPTAFALTSFLFCAFVLVSVLFSIWTNPVGIQQWFDITPYSARIAGRIPFSDAGSWYVGSRLTQDGISVEWAARRPMHVLLRGGELFLSGNNVQWSLLLQAVLCAGGITALVISVWRTLSFAAALVLMALLISCACPFVGTFLSGCSGFTASCIALTFFLEGARRGDYRYRLLGTAALGLSWLLRPGPFALLAVPAVLEWVLKGRNRFIKGVCALGVLLSVLLIGSLTFHFIAKDGAGQNSNAAITIYALTNDIGWSEALDNFYADDPARFAMSVREQSSLQYQLAREAVVSDPSKLLGGLLRGLRNAVEYLFALPVRLIFGKTSLILCLLWTPLMFVCFLAFIRMCANGHPVRFVILGGLVAILISAPVIWTDGGFRGLLILIPFYAVFIVAPLSLRVTYECDRVSRKLPDDTKSVVFGLSIMGIMCLCVCIGASLFLLGSGQKSDDRIEVLVGSDPSVFMVAKCPYNGVFGAPAVSKLDILESLEGENRLDAAVSKFDPPAMIACPVIDERSLMFVIPGAEPRGGLLVISSFRLTSNPHVAEALEWHWAGEKKQVHESKDE